MQDQWPHVRLVCVPANFTAVAQPPDRAFMRPFKACMARLAAEHFAGILVATAPDDPATFDLSVHNLKPVLNSWVGATITQIAEENTFSAAWKSLIPTPDTHEEVLASAQAAHAAGGLFKNVKGRQPPEFAPEPEEAEVDDFDAGDDESQADDQGLLSDDIDPEEAPMAVGEADTLAAADVSARRHNRGTRRTRRTQVSGRCSGDSQ